MINNDQVKCNIRRLHVARSTPLYVVDIVYSVAA